MTRQKPSLHSLSKKIPILKSTPIPSEEKEDGNPFKRVGKYSEWTAKTRRERAAKEILHYTLPENDGLVFSKAAFNGVIDAITKSIGYNLDPTDIANQEPEALENYVHNSVNGTMNFTADARILLQEVTERFLSEEFNLALHCQIDAKRLTLMDKDLHTVARNRFLHTAGEQNRCFYHRLEKLPALRNHDQCITEDEYWDRAWYEERLSEEDMTKWGFKDKEGGYEDKPKWHKEPYRGVNERNRVAKFAGELQRREKEKARRARESRERDKRRQRRGSDRE